MKGGQRRGKRQRVGHEHGIFLRGTRGYDAWMKAALRGTRCVSKFASESRWHIFGVTFTPPDSDSGHNKIPSGKGGVKGGKERDSSSAPIRTYEKSPACKALGNGSPVEI